MKAAQLRLSMLWGPLLLLVMVLCWSSGFIGYRYVADQGGVYLATLWRFLLTAALLLPFACKDLRRLPRRVIGQQAIVGLLAIGTYIAPIAGAIALGVTPGTAAVLANLLPLSIVLLAGTVPGQRTRGWQWLGLLLCLVGMLTASYASVQWTTGHLWAYLLPLLAVVSLAVATLYQKTAPSNTIPALAALFIQICAVVPLFALLAWHEGSLRPSLTRGFALGVLWLVLFATLGGYGVYWACLRRFSMQSISGALFLTPPVTMLWAWLQFGDPLDTSALAGLALTLLGLPLLARGTSGSRRAELGLERHAQR